MALNAKKALAASKSYTDETVLGGGALKGKNCVINSITDIAATSQKPAGKRVTFGWTLDDGTAQTGTMDVYNGEDGQGIDRMYVNAEGHLVVVYDDGTEEDVGEITIPDFQADWNETDPSENSYIKNKPTIPAAQVNSDWNASSGAAEILNKPTLGTAAAKDSTNAVTQSSTDLVESGAVYTELSGKVDTHSTDGVPDRLMTAAEGTKLSGVASGAQVNTIESISVNGSEITPDANKNVALTIVTKAVDDLVNYYLKSETYTKAEVDTLIGAVTGISFEVVSQLPTTDISTTTIYLVPSADPGTQNIKDEYICLDTTTTPATWEKIGSTDIDLSGYVTTSDLNTALADYVLTSTFNTHVATKGDSGVQGHVSLYQGDVSNKTYAQGEAAASAHTHDTRYAPYSVVADISGKADKVQNATNGHLAGLDGSGNLTDSGVAASSVVTDVSGKADKVSSPTAGDFAGLDSNGNLTDSGKKASDFTGKSFTGTAQEWAALSAAQKAEYTGMVNITDDTANAMLVDSTPTYNSNNLVKSGGVNAAIVNMLAPQFDSTKTYYADTDDEALVVYEGVLYKCTTYHSAGAWNPAHFTAINDPKVFIISDGGKKVDGEVEFNDDIWAKNILRFSKSLVGYSSSGTVGSITIGSDDYIKIDSGNYNYRTDKYSMVELDCTYGDSWYGNGGVLKIGAGNTSDGTKSTDIVKGITIDVFHNNDSVSMTGVLNINGSDYAERFETLEDCPVGRFVTLDGERIRLAQPEDCYILGVTSENPAIIGDKDNPGTPVGLVGKLWVEHDGTAKVNGYVCCGKDGIATMELHRQCVYRVMAVDGNRCKILVK